MKTQDKLFDKIKNAAQNQEQKSFDQKEKVWSAVTDKLNRKKRKKMIFYKSLSAAAVIAVIIGIGFSWFNTNTSTSKTKVVESPIIKDIEIEENKNSSIVTEDSSYQKKSKTSTAFKPESLVKKKQESTPNSSDIASEMDEIKAITKDSTPVLSMYDELVLEESILDVEEAEAYAIRSSKVTNAENAKVSKTITGNVFDQDSLPLPGVDIVVKGTTRGTQTGFDGAFSIEIEPKQTLVFSYLGFVNQEIKIENHKKRVVILKEDVSELDQVVVTAYANETKKAFTKSLAVVSDVEVSKTLQGQVAGVNIRTGNGQPSSANIVIRGSSSMSYSKSPLYIIDGKPINKDDLSQLNPDKIEAVNVLKETNATEIYGSKGANGVILILTKDAKQKEKKEFDSIINTKQFPIQPNTEDYETYKENPFTSPLSEPLSTFSIDVDRAAYTNIRRMINNGQEVPKDAVRIEEMLNFFEYDYAKPTDKHPFAIHTAYSDAPWNKNHQLLKIALQGKDVPIAQLPASNLVFLIDVSGSMSDQNKLPLVKKSLKLLTDQMRDKDKIALVTYASNSRVALEPTSGNQKTKIKNAIDQLSAGGSTFGSQGIETAYQLAEENFVKGGNNRVIVATDGDFNMGVTQNESLEELIAKKRETTIFLTCLGYGMGNYKDSKMQSLSQKGNGNYAYIDTYQEAQKFLEREFKGSMYAIAKDVKIQIEFNPKHVDSYRLIGYETRMLEDSDFDDDTKDAGEIGVNHQVTALYEVVPRGVDSPFDEFKPDLKYQKVETPSFENHSDELATVKFRYKPPQSDKSIKMERIIKNISVQLENADGDFKFATAVAWFGLKLRDSKLITKSDKEDIIKLAKQGLENDKEGYRAEFIRLVNMNN